MRFARTLLWTTTFGLCTCSRQASDLREWQPSDHDQPTSQAQAETQSDGGNPMAARGIDQVTIVAWTENCVRCHGQFGAGDGPQGPMTHARDLTNAEWQSTTTDDAIGSTIRQGRGLMPAFKLPDSTVASLVRLVRLLGERRNAQGQADGQE